METLGQTVEDYLNNPAGIDALRSGARNLAQPNAAHDIVNHLESLWTWKA